MRIVSVQVENFRLFEQREFRFHPEFNLVIGENGAGKTAALRILTVCLNRALEGLKATPEEACIISDDDLRDKIVIFGDEQRNEKFNAMVFSGEWYLTASSAMISRYEEELKFSGEPRRRYDWSGVEAIPGNWAIDESFLAPLVANYSCDRLRPLVKNESPQDVIGSAILAKYKRRDGYAQWFCASTGDNGLVEWLLKQDVIAYQEKSETLGWRVLTRALVKCLDGFTGLSVIAKQADVVVHLADNRRMLFRHMSEGQRMMIGLIGDLVRRAVLLNPQLGDKVLDETAGVVLIDELDLHLHPKWQRRIIEDLRKTFPKIQFICTTHSPFLIQSLRSGEELLMLEGQPTAQLANMSVEEIAQGIMGVSNPQVSQRYGEMTGAARDYLETLDAAAMAPAEELNGFKAQLAETISPYADNPAFQALLEMKRAAKLGE